MCHVRRGRRARGETTGVWQWKDVREALYETIDLAKLRAVEPRHIDNTTYAQLLPALVIEELEDVPGIAPEPAREVTE
jgi:hypothetical protein